MRIPLPVLNCHPLPAVPYLWSQMEMSISLLGSTIPLLLPPPPPPSQLRGANTAVGTGDGRTTAGGAALTFPQSMGRGRPRGAGAVPEPPACGSGSYKAVARGSG